MLASSVVFHTLKYFQTFYEYSPILEKKMSREHCMRQFECFIRMLIVQLIATTLLNLLDRRILTFIIIFDNQLLRSRRRITTRTNCCKKVRNNCLDTILQKRCIKTLYLAHRLARQYFSGHNRRTLKIMLSTIVLDDHSIGHGLR